VPNISPVTLAVVKQFHQKVNEAQSKINDPQLLPFVVTELEQAADSACVAVSADPNAPSNCRSCTKKLEESLDKVKNQFKQAKGLPGSSGEGIGSKIGQAVSGLGEKLGISGGGSVEQPTGISASQGIGAGPGLSGYGARQSGM